MLFVRDADNPHSSCCRVYGDTCSLKFLPVVGMLWKEGCTLIGPPWGCLNRQQHPSISRASYLENCSSCAGELTVVNDIGTDRLTRWRMMILIDTVAGERRGARRYYVDTRFSLLSTENKRADAGRDKRPILTQEIKPSVRRERGQGAGLKNDTRTCAVDGQSGESSDHGHTTPHKQVENASIRLVSVLTYTKKMYCMYYMSVFSCV